MQTTIVFALFCEAFIGGVSSAHGEIFWQKSAYNHNFETQKWFLRSKSPGFYVDH